MSQVNHEQGYSGPVIDCRDLCFSYQLGETRYPVLDLVSLQIEPGEMVAIMGPSGSGKSTLMNLIGCLMKPTSGSLLINNQPINTLSPAELAHLRSREIGFVFQQFNLLPRTSALENVKLPLMYRQQRVSNPNQLAQDKLELVGLGDRLSNTPAQLSGGQQQRVAIARALVNEPKILLADEPTGALDSKTGREIMQLFSELNRQGITVLLITHEADVAAYADRIITVRDGQILSQRQSAAGQDIQQDTHRNVQPQLQQEVTV